VFSEIYLFKTPSDLEGLFDSFFKGLFLVKGVPIFFQLGFLVCFAFACIMAKCFQKNPTKLSERLCLLATLTGLILAAFLLYQPWDEGFIFLRHSLHLGDSGNFSFNRGSRIEGIVDFLPFFILGILSKFGLPLLETGFWMGVLGGWLCILAGRRILLLLNIPEARAWSYPLLLVYPPLLLNVSNGFPVLIFSASILWAVIFLFFEKSWWRGCFFLSLVPLFRIEGLWFLILCLLFWILSLRSTQPWRKITLGSVIVFLPAALLTVWRWQYFGSPLPVPVIYKSSPGHLLYSLLGLRNLLMDLTATGAILFFLPLFQKPSQSIRKNLVDSLGLLLFLFSLPYYVSGGDWFPAAWGRYLFPFAFFSFIKAIGWCLDSRRSLISLDRPYILGSCLLFMMIILLPFGSVPKIWQELLSHRSTLAGLTRKKGGQSNYRIQQLSQLGTHLFRTTPTDTVIASSEIATIMYFANRECLDLLGLTNIEIARSPLRTSPQLFSKLKSSPELPYLIFKRLNPDILFKHRPQIVYAFDFFLKDLLKNEDLGAITESELVKATSIWNRQFEKMNFTLFGGVERLQKAGYVPVIIQYGDTFHALYFVSEEAKKEHFEKMVGSGMRMTALKSNHL